MPENKKLLDLFLDFEDIYFRNYNYYRIGIIRKEAETKKKKKIKKKEKITKKTKKKINFLDLSYKNELLNVRISVS